MKVILKIIWISIFVAGSIQALKMMDEADELRFPGRHAVE
jgi:hypothetical protein